jgi:Na+/H+ antiporter NhaD/arsenite permease-like protein
LSVWVSTISILAFVFTIFFWVYDSNNSYEKYSIPTIGITAFIALISLALIAPPHQFSHDELMILIVLFFIIVFTFLTLAEEEKLRVILFGAALAITLSIIFLNELLPNLPFSPEQIGEIEREPAKFFEIAIFEVYIEWEVISIVFGMSLLVAVLSATGLFDMVSIRTIKMSKGVPKVFLVLVFFLTLILSAFLDNTTAIILLSGMTITVTQALDLNPKPYILAEIIATVMAGIITVIGSIPGILIAGSHAGNIPFLTFSLVNSGFIVVSIIICLSYIFFIFRQELIIPEDYTIDSRTLDFLDEWSVVDSRRKLYLGSAVLIFVVIGLVLSSSIGLSVGFVAITGAVLAIVVTQADMEHVLKEIELDSILFFIGLFILVGTLQISGALEVLAEAMLNLSGGDPLILAIIMVFVVSILSAVVANIPVTIALAEVINILLEDSEFASQTVFGHPVAGLLWFTLLYAVTFGGGFTPFGTVTGVLGVQVLANEGHPVSFMEFVKKMLPLSAILLFFGFIYLLFLQMTGILPLLYNPS